MLPVFERLGDVREKAVTMGRIADALQDRGQLDEALKLRREGVPIYEAVGDKQNLMLGRMGIAVNLLAMNKPEHIPEARALLLAAEAAAIEMKLPVDLAAIRSWFPDVGLPS